MSCSSGSDSVTRPRRRWLCSTSSRAGIVHDADTRRLATSRRSTSNGGTRLLREAAFLLPRYAGAALSLPALPLEEQ